MEDISYSQLIEDSIKLHFERNGTLDEMRSGLHAKVLTMLHEQKKLRKNEPLCGGDLEQRGLSNLLNQLIVDYFDWYGYKHTLETFSLETGLKNKRSREKLRRELKGNFEHKDLPVLLEMLMQRTNRNDSKPSEEEQPKQVPKKMETYPKNLTKVQGTNLKSPKLPPHGNMNATVETVIKVNKLHEQKTTKTNNTNFQAKVNVRQRMSEVEKKVPKKPKAKKSVEQHKNIYDTDTGSDSTKSTTEEDVEDTESSETFADIPNRYYYREQDPPEKSYPHNYGEEGLYEGQPQKVTKSVNSRKVEKSKMIKIFEMDCKDKKPKVITKDAPKTQNTKSKTSDQYCTGKRGKFTYNPHRRLNHSEEDLNMPVSKPKCPDTIISSIKMDSADDTDDDSDVYL